MEMDGTLAKVTEPTDWVNSPACSWKPIGDLQVHLDPKDLSKAIKQRYLQPKKSLMNFLH